MTTEKTPVTPSQALDFLRHSISYVDLMERDRLRQVLPSFRSSQIYENPAREILVRAFAHVCMDSDICMYCNNDPPLGTHCHFCGRA